MSTKFAIQSMFQDFPLIYWNPKFHKNPVKFRPIAGSKNKVLCPMEKVIGKILKHFTNHFIAYCRVCERQSGHKHYFSIKNSSEMRTILSNLNGKATSLDAFDFSNLYTNFEHDEIIERLSWLIDLLLDNAGKERIVVHKNDHNVAYIDRDVDSNECWTFNRIELKNAISFLIKNTYVRFGSLILQQIKGIPMGSIPAPDMANLALAVDEFRFVKRLLQGKAYPILKKLDHMARYLDDVAIPNFPDFTNHVGDIYPSTLTLSKSNESDTQNIPYLDLSISVMDQNFEIKVYCKTDDYDFNVISLPFLESNVSVEMCYYVYYGQVLRFLRICTQLEYFKERCIFLTNLLKRRNYCKKKLSVKLNQVLLRNKKDWFKFSRFISVRELMMKVVYEA